MTCRGMSEFFIGRQSVNSAEIPKGQRYYLAPLAASFDYAVEITLLEIFKCSPQQQADHLSSPTSPLPAPSAATNITHNAHWLLRHVLIKRESVSNLVSHRWKTKSSQPSRSKAPSRLPCLAISRLALSSHY